MRAPKKVKTPSEILLRLVLLLGACAASVYQITTGSSKLRSPKDSSGLEILNAIFILPARKRNTLRNPDSVCDVGHDCCVARSATYIRRSWRVCDIHASLPSADLKCVCVCVPHLTTGSHLLSLKLLKLA